MNSLKEQFENETGWICSSGKQSSRRYIEWLEQRADHDWEFCHEPIARLYREIKKATPIPYGHLGLHIHSLIDKDVEVRIEIENLLTKIIEDIENA